MIYPERILFMRSERREVLRGLVFLPRDVH